MRLAFKAALLVLSLQVLSGCAFINSFNSDLDKQVDIWMAQHEYARVLDTLKYVRPSNPKYKLLQRKRQQAIAEARRYEKAQIAKSLTLIEKGQWHQADLVLSDAREKLPDSRALRKTYEEFTIQRDQYLKNLYTQFDINKAEWLVKNKPVELKLMRTLPDDNQTRQAMADFNQQTREVFPQLIKCGEQAEKAGDLQLARQCYQLADKLQPDPGLKKILVRVQLNLEQQLLPIPQPGQQTPKLSLLGRTLLQKSKKALDAGNLKLALNHYEKIPDDDKQLPVIRNYRKKMDRRIHENVSQGIELGRKLYSQGQVEQALAVWNKLRDIDPDNENLLSHIDRAERVLEKIKQLRKEQQPQTAPKHTLTK